VREVGSRRVVVSGWLRPYLIASVSTIAATALTGLLGPTSEHSRFTFYFLAVILTAIYGNREAGMLAIVLAALSSSYFFFPPDHRVFQSSEALSAVCLFGIVSGIIVLLIARLKNQARTMCSSDADITEAVREAAQLESERARLVVAQAVAREELRLSEQRFRQMAENSDEVFWMTDPIKSEVLYVSPAYEKIWGRTCASLYAEPVAVSVLNTVHPEDQQRVAQAFTTTVTGSFDLTYRIVRPGGSWRWIHHRCYPVKNDAGETYRLAGIAADVTEKLDAEKQVREQAALLDEARDAICVTDLDQRILFWNKGAESLYGWPAKEALGRNANVLLGQSEVALTALKTLIQHGEWRGDLLQTTRDGRALVVDCRWTLIRERDGAPKSILVISTDITEARHAAEQIREQAALLDHAQDAILVHDLEGVLTFWNKSAERVFGWTAEEILGCNVQDLLYESPERYQVALAGTLQRGAWIGDITKRTKAGADVLVECRWTLLRDEDGKPTAVLAINTDITERKQLETQLFRAQRMESIGTLAGGIAHDLNNVLGPIIMAVDLMKLRATDPHDRALLALMESSSRRGADMVKQVLYFARGVEGRRASISPAPLVKELQQMIRDTFPKSITVDGEVSPDVWNAPCDRTQLHQVLLNLCVNARDAMPAGGELRINARNFVVDEHFAGMHPDGRPGSYVVFEVVDNGVGMSAEVAGRIFDPFFTTKPLGEGTGLGLFTTRSIVQGHGGFITLQSTPGEGTTFQVYLPADLEPAETAAEEAGPDYPRGHGEMILIIDDEASIRTITSETLEAFGYRVMTAGDGADGVAQYAKHAAEIAAVLTDIMMPVMDGVAAIRILRRLNPEVKIIATSGSGGVEVGHEALEVGANHFIAKPYTAEILLESLRQLLHPINPPERVTATA
jgi:PAS domain S-box-containing protein